MSSMQDKICYLALSQSHFTPFMGTVKGLTRDLLDTMETIREAGAGFQSLSEPWANTTTHAGKMIMTVFGTRETCPKTYC
jgi:hypothetical protein